MHTASAKSSSTRSRAVAVGTVSSVEGNQPQPTVNFAVQPPSAAAIIGRRLVEEAVYLNPQFQRVGSGQLVGAQCCGCSAAVRNWTIFVPENDYVRKRKRMPYASRLRFAFGSAAPICSPMEFAVALYNQSFQRWFSPCPLCGRDRRDHRGRSHFRAQAADPKHAAAESLSIYTDPNAHQPSTQQQLPTIVQPAMPNVTIGPIIADDFGGGYFSRACDPFSGATGSGAPFDDPMLPAAGDDRFSLPPDHWSNSFCS
jgi:hypothetical protein